MSAAEIEEGHLAGWHDHGQGEDGHFSLEPEGKVRLAKDGGRGSGHELCVDGSTRPC